MIKFILRSTSKIQALAFLHRNQNLYYIVITIFSSTIASMISFYPLKKVTYVTLIQSEIMKNIPLFEKKIHISKYIRQCFGLAEVLPKVD